MTVHDATNKLLEFFAQNDCFTLRTDFKKIVLISDNDGDKAAILAGLEELQKQNLVIKKDINGVDFWVLVRPLSLQLQEVAIPLALSLEVSNFINNIEPVDNTRSNPFNISGQDILNLLLIAKKV